jgi:hypothetical protein
MLHGLIGMLSNNKQMIERDLPERVASEIIYLKKSQLDMLPIIPIPN